MVNQVNRTSNVANAGQIVLRPPSELYTQQPQRKTYNQDAVSVAGSSAISEIGQFGVGALSGYKYQGNFVGASQKLVNSIKTGGIGDVTTGLKDFGSTVGHDAYNAAGVGAILSGGVSALANGAGLLSGRVSLQTAGANVVTDSIKGAVSGIGGLAVGGTSAMLLTSFGLAGTPVVIASVVGGAIGASMANKLVGTEHLRHMLSGY